MFVGHFAVAFVLIQLFPSMPVWVPLAGVSFPDLLWALLIFAGKEEVVLDRNSPLQRGIKFLRFPYSHSLVLTNAMSFSIGAVVGVASGYLAILGVAFHLANANSFIGISKKNPFVSPNAYAGAALLGFGASSAAYALVL